MIGAIISVAVIVMVFSVGFGVGRVTKPEFEEIDEDRRYEVDEIAGNSKGRPSDIIPPNYLKDYRERTK